MKKEGNQLNVILRSHTIWSVMQLPYEKG